MNETLGTFDRLVLTLESSQRQEMLRHLAAATELQEEESKALTPNRIESDRASISPEQQLLAEPFFIRFIYMVYAFFTSSTPVRLYSESLVTQLGRRLKANFAPFIDVPQSLYTDALYQELLRLRETQGFFSVLLGKYEEDKGDFFIVLASLLMKKTSESILNITDPFSHEFKHDQNKDVRLLLLRELDTVFSALPDEERGQMYQAVQAIEWIKGFCAVPLEHMCQRFGHKSTDKPVCAIDALESELKQLTNSLYGARRIPVLLLEALFLFSEQAKLQENTFDLEGECSAFTKKASGHLSGIRQVKSAVPLADFVRFSSHDVAWQPVSEEGGEDWLMLFKTAWKKRLEDRAAAWNRLHRKEMLQKDVCSFLDTAEIPTLSHHPWEGVWMSLAFRRELSMAFLERMYGSIYPLMLMKPLKILLIEGDFYRRENLEEFTDAFSTLEHQQQVLENFEHRLSPKGDIGEGYALIQKEKMATIRNKARLENLMLNIESEAEDIISRNLVAFRSMDAILGGILAVARGGPYETLVNMAAIQGKQNERYRKELSIVRQTFQSACQILAEAEVIEKE